jgi:hypothetical protein
LTRRQANPKSVKWASAANVRGAADSGQARGSNMAMTITKPLVLMFKKNPDKNENVQCHLYPRDDFGYEAYGLPVCDLVRHIANAFNVDEDAVWEWVDKERTRPTLVNPH